MQQKGFAGQWSWVVKYGDRQWGPPKIREERTTPEAWWVSKMGGCFFVLLPLDIQFLQSQTGHGNGLEKSQIPRRNSKLCCLEWEYDVNHMVLGSYFICCEIKLCEGPRVSYDRSVCTKLCAWIISEWLWLCIHELQYRREMIGSYMEDSRIPHNSENWRVGTHAAHVGQYCTSVIQLS